MAQPDHREKELREELTRLQQQRMKGQHTAQGHAANPDVHKVQQAARHVNEIAKHLKNIVPIFRKNPLLAFSPIKTLPDYFRDYSNAQRDFARANDKNNPGAASRAKARMAGAMNGILRLSMQGKLEFEIMEKAAHHAFNELK